MNELRLAVLAVLLAAACSAESPHEVIVAGDPERGRLLLRQYACGACHRIPGVAVAQGNVGPPLERMRAQVYLAGVLPNTPDNMVRFIRSPQQVDPLSMMPNLSVGEEHARDIVAYLLRE